jgi:hypothetical protein
VCGIGNDAGEMVRMRQIKLNNQIHQENNQALVMKAERFGKGGEMMSEILARISNFATF